MDGLSPRATKTLYKIAKDKRKGVYPFFKDPKLMIELRLAKEKLDAEDQNRILIQAGRRLS